MSKKTIFHRPHEIPLEKAFKICLSHFGRYFIYIDGLSYIFSTDAPKFSCFEKQIQKYNEIRCEKCASKANVCFIETTFDQHPMLKKKLSIKAYNRITEKNCHINFYHRNENELISMTLDHIIPVSKGGPKYSPFNLQILCQNYNLAKGNKIEYLPRIPEFYLTRHDCAEKLRKLQEEYGVVS